MEVDIHRSPAIDTLRGAAIGVVLVLHFALAYGLRDSALGDLVGRDAVRALVVSGNYGVTVFFTVSGYLIASMTRERDGALSRLRPRAFAWRRVSRLAPGLLLALGIIVPAGLCGAPSFMNEHAGVPMPASFMGVAVASVLTFWHPALMAREGYFNYALNVYWSLSVEECFYLAFALACVCSGALARRGQARASRWLLPSLGLACVVASPLYRFAHGDDEIRYLYANAACADALAIGVATAALVGAFPLRRGVASTWLALGGTAALVATYAIGFAQHVVFGFTAMALASACVLAASSATGTPAAPSSVRRALLRAGAPLRWAGRHSYELYLFHIIVLGALRDVLPRSAVGHDARVPWLIAFLVASAVVAGAVARWVTGPAERWLRGRHRAAVPFAGYDPAP